MIADLEGEVWKDIAGFPGYGVSNMGRVRSFWKRVYKIGITGSRSHLADEWHLVVQTITKKGYAVVGLRRNGKTSQLRVNRLVLTAFSGPPTSGMEGRHLDGDPLNNKYSNLAWCTAKENADDRLRHGRTAFGERNGFVKLTKDLVFKIRKMRSEGCVYREISAACGVCESRVCAVANGQAWTSVKEEQR